MMQRAVRQMLEQGTEGSVTTISAALADNSIAGVPASIPMITKGLNAVTVSFGQRICTPQHTLDAVAPGGVNMHLHKNTPQDLMKTLSPMGTVAEAEDIAEAVVYLTEARCVTAEVLHVDGGAHTGRW
jgi:NAD(P)-dependent dehydrogenase (short-subunit alcohol dehydrogenase family)